MIHLQLPITDYRPEEMRVRTDNSLFLVETYSMFSKSWCVSAEHEDLCSAIQDAVNWYKPDNSFDQGKLKQSFAERGVKVHYANNLGF